MSLTRWTMSSVAFSLIEFGDGDAVVGGAGVGNVDEICGHGKSFPRVGKLCKV